MAVVTCDLALSGGVAVCTNTCRENTTITVGSFSSAFGSVLGGRLNSMIMCGEFSTIVMGCQNHITCAFSPAPSVFDFILNGVNAKVQGNYNSVMGGNAQCIMGVIDNSVIAGGSLSCIFSRYSTIASGCKNTIRAGSAYSFIGSGKVNSQTGNCQTIFGGCNQVMTGSANFIGGGSFHVVSADYNNIVGGISNEVSAGSFSNVGGGNTNKVHGSSSAVAGGNTNTINVNSNNSYIGGGASNSIASNISCAVVGGGLGNILQGNHSSIFGGCGNIIAMQANCSFIGGGQRNRIDTPALHNVVLGGSSNLICSVAASLNFNNFMGGGTFNWIGARLSAVFGGNGNTVWGGSCCSAIVGGREQTIHWLSCASFIGGGRSNIIGTSMCRNNFYNAILSGELNCIFDNQYAFIAGGMQNTLTGDCSAILGGRFNNDAGVPGVGIFGDSVLGTLSDAFHTNKLVAQNMPGVPGVPGSRTLYWQPVIVMGVPRRRVFIN